MVNSESYDVIKNKLLSAKDVMKITGLSNRKVYQIFKQDDFGSFRIGNRLYIRQYDFETWLENQKRKK